MIRHCENGITFYEFETLSMDMQVAHAVFTRQGGQSQPPFDSLNVGHLLGDDPDSVQANHELIFHALAISPQRVVTARQVHGAHVANVGSAEAGTVVPSTDGLVTAETGLYLMLRFADCLPVMLYDPARHTMALVHVGWRGLLAGVIHNTIRLMERELSTEPPNVLAGLGPAIGPCCYEVGPDVVRAIQRVFGSQYRLVLVSRDARVHFDLPTAARLQLQSEGVLHIESSGLCSSCHTDEFFSHRAENGRTGRFAVLLGLRPA
jgi:hypothetical protein